MAKDSGSKIKDWPEAERPRERLMQVGPQSLSDAQLLAILLRTGHLRQNAVELALKLLGQFGGLGPLSQASVGELCRVCGIGPAKAALLRAALELGRRSLSSPLHAGVKIQCSQDVQRHYHPQFRGLKREQFKVILLDGRHRILKDVVISEGSLTNSLVHPREAFNPAVRESAGAVIFIHNLCRASHKLCYV